MIMILLKTMDLSRFPVTIVGWNNWKLSPYNARKLTHNDILMVKTVYLYENNMFTHSTIHIIIWK